MLGRAIDAALAPFFPALAARRVRERNRYEALSAYAAGERNRKNKDWRPRNVSADAAILGDFETILPRARDLMRSNWAGKSIVKAFGRNVIGRGMTASAVAKSPKGKERRKFNERRDWLFSHWASRAKHCDIERKQTLARKVKMAVEEMAGVGQHFLVWSYVPNPESVGLRLQSFEPEQLDFVRVVNPDTGFQIRRGIEVDDYGAPVAYWFYPRPINDYYGFQPAGIDGSLFYESKRIPADRVLHLFDQERTRQTHGVSWLAPVMNKVRDTQTFDDATLMKAKVEASVALEVNKSVLAGGSLPSRKEEEGDGSDRPDNVSRDGGRQYAFEPAMIFEALPGESIKIIPQQNGGSNYDPFMKMNLRSAGAGVGLSYDVVARDYDEGSYSSKRQGALEDRREYGCHQDLSVDVVYQPVIELFTKFAVLEGKLDAPGFFEDPAPWMETDWAPDGFEWIDPAKEAAGASIRLDKRLDTRKSIIGGRGGNWRRTFQQLADEQDEADRVHITLPDVEPTAPKSAGDGAEPAAQKDPPTPPAKEKKPADDKPSLADRLIETVLTQALAE